MGPWFTHPVIGPIKVEADPNTETCPQCDGTGEIAVCLPCDTCAGIGRVTPEVLKKWNGDT